MSPNLLLANIEKAIEIGKPVRWLDWFDYGRKVVLNGKDIPWGDTTALVNFIGQGRSLLKLGVVSIDLGDYFAWWLKENPSVLETMAGKKRIGFALKTFLGNPALRATLKELVGSVASASETPLVLVVPSPRLLLPWAHDTANGVVTERVEDIAVDSATVYLADFLREFSDRAIAGILIREGGLQDFGATLGSLYRPLNNIGEAYQWSVGLDLNGSEATDLEDFDFVISKVRDCASLVAHPLPDDFWTSGECHYGAFVFGKIPVDAIPETVLEILDRVGG
jgi:hypothetical protein